jgi:hypothetical protein
MPSVISELVAARNFVFLITGILAAILLSQRLESAVHTPQAPANAATEGTLAELKLQLASIDASLDQLQAQGANESTLATVAAALAQLEFNGTRLHVEVDNTTHVNTRPLGAATDSVAAYGRHNATSTNIPLDVNEYGQLGVELHAPLTAFGELKTESSTPNIQLTFQYNKNPDYVHEHLNGSGVISVDPPFLKLETGTTANTCAEFTSVNYAKYRPGQGILMRFTTVFSAPVTDTTQYMGIGDDANGFFFGYNAAGEFGTLRRTGGRHEIRTLEIATASSQTEYLSFTLDDVAYSGIWVTNSGDISTSATEIAAHSFSGWHVSANGSSVVFLSHSSTPHTGTFSMVLPTSLRATDATFPVIVAGINPTEYFTPSSDWNTDTCDGSGGTSNPSLFNHVPTYGNVYQIQFQWLGFGAIKFGIERTSTGRIHPVHVVKYANTATETSIARPSNHASARVCTTNGVTTNMVLKSPSIAVFVEGQHKVLGPTKSIASIRQNIGNNDEDPLLSIRAALTYDNQFSYIPILPERLYVADQTAGADVTTFRVYKGGDTYDTAGQGYQNVDLTRSGVQAIIKPTGWNATGAVHVASIVVTDKGGDSINLANIGITLQHGESLTVTGAPVGGSSYLTAAITWREDL